MADQSKVLVRLQLLGGSLFNREAKQAGENLKGVGRSARTAGGGLSQTSSSGARATTALGRVQAATKRTAAEMRGLHSAASKALDPVKRIGAAGVAGAGLGFGAAIKDSANFEQAMANVQSKLLTTQGNMSRLTGLALQLGAKTNYSAGQAASAMGELAAQGFDTEKIMRVLPGTLSLAAASGTDLANAAAIQTETLNAFGLGASKANHVADVLAQTANLSAANIDDMQESLKYIAPVAKATGQSLQDVGAAIGLMSNVGIKGSQAGTTLRTAMVRLTKPTDKARAALSTLHLKAGDLVGKKGLLSLPNIMTKISAGARGVSKNQRNAAIATIFGREALSGMVALVDKGPAKLKKMSDALLHSTGAARRAAHIQRTTVKGAFDNLTGSVETAAISLTKRYMPALRRAINASAGGVNEFTKGLSTGAAAPHRRVVRGAGGRVESVQTVQASGAQRAGAAVHGVIGAAISGAKTLAAKALPAIGQVVKQLLDALKPAMPFVRNVLLPLLKGIAQGVLGSVVAAFKIAVPIIKIVAIALGFIGKAAAPLRPIIQGLGMVIGFFAAGPILKLLGTVPKVGIVFRLMAVPIRIVGAVVSRVARLFRAFANGLQFVNRWLAFSRSGFGRALGAVTNFASGVIGRLARLPSQAVAKIRGMLGGIIRFLKGGGPYGMAFRAAAPIGKAIVNGIINLIKKAPAAIGAALAWVVDQLPIPGFVKGKVKDVIGVHARGGVVRTPLQLVGERGPELAALPRGSRVFTAGQTRQMMRPSFAAPRSAQVMAAAAPSPPIVIHFRPEIDGRPIHSSVHRIERARVEAT